MTLTDNGIDGRIAKAGSNIVLQAKHYRISGFSALARKMRHERKAIDSLDFDRYLLATSVSLTPSNKCSLADTIGPRMRGSEDLLGFEDLNGLLRSHESVAKSHVKLWLSDTAVLERVLHASTHNFGNISRAEITAKLNVYAENPSFADGRTILEQQRVLIISGPPGIGKTTLAEMLAYAYIGEDWDLIAIRSLEEGFAHIDDSRKQVFYFDDFLGRIALDKQSLSAKDSDLARFMGRVRRTPTARFILTTRAYIYEEARLFSESLSDPRLDVNRYVLDIGVYTRRIKARILYNHLIVAGAPTEHIRALYESGTIKKIVDHTHYNPRIIEWMTDSNNFGNVAAVDYPNDFIRALDNPDSIWDKAFRHHIARRCQHLLFALYFCSEYGAELEDVREVFDGIHPLLCKAYGLTSDAKDFEETLRTLEGSFVTIANMRVSFTNPSVRDYLNKYLIDKALVTLIAPGAPTALCAVRIEEQFNKINNTNQEDLNALLTGFTSLCKRLNKISQWRRALSSNDRTLRLYDSSNSARLKMLLDWWRATENSIFINTAVEIAGAPVGGFTIWGDAKTLPEILADLLTASEVEQCQTRKLSNLIELALSRMLESMYDPDELNTLISAIEDYDILESIFATKIPIAISEMINNTPENLGHIDSGSTLNEFLSIVATTANRISHDPTAVTQALDAIKRRIEEIGEEAETEEELSVTGAAPTRSEIFDDEDLANLFAPLMAIDTIDEQAV